ncbi:MAG: lysine--tRNA ligase [Patescibacteria group bacterium]
MFWVDHIADEIIKAFPGKKSFIVRDEKTLSGRVHIGSLRGFVIHGVVAQALRERGCEVRYIFELNDADPMDGMPVYLDEKKFAPFMGKPLKDVPSPEPGFKNFPDYFGQEIKSVIEKMGFREGKEIEYVLASELYSKGIYNKWIDKVLQSPEKIRAIYKEVSGSEKGDDWYPLQVICEKCGKIGTTRVIGVHGKEVEYHCEENMVKWARGCGYNGKTDPYDGRGKLPWKVEWAVKWQGNNVDIEGSGKDHNAAGGSRDVSVRVATEVLGGHVPFNIPYEFFLFGGAKMSSSKGKGASAKEVSDLIPPEMLRFLMIGKQPNQPIDFDPEGDTIPRLYDRHDDVARVYFGGKPEFTNVEIDENEKKDMKRLYHFSQTDPSHADEHFLPRFSRVAFLLQLPHIDVEKEVEKLKGGTLTVEDEKELGLRVELGKKWLSDYASERVKFELQKNTPEVARNLTPDQQKFLRDIADLMDAKESSGEELHGAIHELRKQSPLDAKNAFAAIYIALLGKDSGPQAGWFLEALDKEFVVKRFREVSNPS